MSGTTSEAVRHGAGPGHLTGEPRRVAQDLRGHARLPAPVNRAPALRRPAPLAPSEARTTVFGRVSIARLPVYVVAAFGAALAVPLTRGAATSVLLENGPVELLTFAFLVAGGAVGLGSAWRRRRRGEPVAVVAFHALFALGLLAVGGEEVAWGQWFWGFETPEALREANTQGELTLHNHRVFNDHLEAFPLLFGVGGAVGVWLARFDAFRPVGVPRVLLSWFLVIAAFSLVDLVQDFVVIDPNVDLLVNWMDEVVEMLVGVSGFLYVRLSAARAREPGASPRGA